MRKLTFLLKTQGIRGLARPIGIRLRLLYLWLISLPLFICHVLICILVSPAIKFRVGVFPSERIGHFALNPELYMRRHVLQNHAENVSKEYTVFFSGRPANTQLLLMWKRKLHICLSPFLHSIFNETHKLWDASPFFVRLEMLSNEFAEFNASPPTLSFTEIEMERGWTELAKWGFDRNKDWFVCVFARDANYLSTVYPDSGDWSYHDYRNADIEAFVPSMEEIVRRGGFVFRMGFHVAKPLNIKCDRIIDYASVARDDFMDIFLAANCSFFLGTTSGIADVAMIFDRPRVGVDWVPFGNAPWGKNNLFIPKLLADRATGQLIPFARLLQVFSQRSDRKIWDGNWAFEQGYVHIDNTDEEILDVTCEILDRLANTYISTPEDDALQHNYRNLFPADHWSVGINTPIGAKFLRKYKKLLVV